ncbi:hypothetical protein NL676_007280 [Syzygium grande]|nr:hypothetical protein NL676_007280 [Syzygium grande]
MMDQQLANILGLMLMLLFLVADQYYVKNMPPFIAWIRYLSISHYTYKLLMGSQFKPEDAYPCGESSCLVRDSPGIKKVGLDGHVVSEIALEITFVWYRLIAYIVLMRIGMTKRRKSQAFFFPNSIGQSIVLAIHHRYRQVQQQAMMMRS